MAPSAHGAVRVGQKLSPAAVTLAERLQGDGYATVALSANPFVSRTWGLAQGFDHFEQPLRAPSDRSSAEALARRALELLDSDCPRPCFLYLHFIDPHDPYTPHAQHEFDAGPTGRLKGGEEIGALRALDPELQADELAFIVASYDEEIAATDVAVGRLLTGLSSRGRRADAVLALTADHGEEFMGRGWLGHTRTLYEELLRVPLVVSAPGVAPEVRSEPVALQQLAPTLAAFAGVSTGDEARLPIGEAKVSETVVFSEVDFVPINESERLKTAKKQAVVQGTWKLIRDGRGGGPELYNLERDPAERTNLAGVESERLATLGAVLDQQAKAAGAEPLPRVETRMSDEEQEQLRHLGYIE
jgi:arylsulfatase A-like enzyme